MVLPDDYLKYYNNGGTKEWYTDWDGCFSFRLLKIDELDKINNDASVQKYFPGHIIFANNSTDEYLAFDKNGAVFRMPMIVYSGNDRCIFIAKSWSVFVSRFKKEMVIE